MSDGGDPLGRCLREEIVRGAMPGAAFWVGDGRSVVTGVAGDATLEPAPVPVRVDTPFDLASLTKPLATALLATMLDQEGRLSLETPLAAVFPELNASPFDSATLRDAAAHRAGFPAWVPLYRIGRTRDAYLEAIARCERRGPTGATLYSDLGYVLLGFAVERATGDSLDRVFEERIARPLSLLRCGFGSAARPFDDAAATERERSYERALAGAAPSDRASGPVPRGEVHDGNAWGLNGVAGHAGLFGTAADVAAIALAILDPRRLGLAPEALDAMLHPVADGVGVRTVGFVTAVDSESVRGILPDGAVGHLGFTGTSLWIDRARPRIYVLLTNRIHPEVPSGPFTPTRREFHALAAALP